MSIGMDIQKFVMSHPEVELKLQDVGEELEAL
jgi:hypothetical protein